jgi:molybdate-binding protein/transcriptional regulator with XRE-family HTH domain
MSSIAGFFNQVRDRRRSRGWTQAELARQTGVSRAAISAIEIRRLVPSVTAALRIAACLGCTVEELFSNSETPQKLEWAWPPDHAESRYWRAEIAGRLLSIPVEETASGEMAHDGVMESRADRYAPQFAPAQTLIMACCDPAAGLLASEYGRQTGLRMIVLPRSSGAALSLLAQGRIHVAGVHLAGAGESHGNAGVVDRKIDKPVGLLRLAQWQEGVAIGSDNKSNSLRSVLHGRLKWVGREEGSGARQCFKELLGGRRPALIARDHRAVATAVSAGWADAGICLRLVCEESGLRFLPVRFENYDLAFLKSSEADPRVQALVRVVRSAEYRRLLAELPGYDARETGGLEWTAKASRRLNDKQAS